MPGSQPNLAAACPYKQGHHNARQQGEADEHHTSNHHRESLPCAK